MNEKTKRSPNAERNRFTDAARALECDESEERFDVALRKVAAHKPKNESNKTGAEEDPVGTRHRGPE
jgi:hypothetical protein